MPKVVVYLKADDWRRLEQQGKDPKDWVKTLVARAMERQREEKKE